jgi:hypothetical protein
MLLNPGSYERTWRTLLYRCRELVAEVVSIVLRHKEPEEHVEQLASELVDYAHMNTPVPGVVVVYVPEIAYRLRESTFSVRRGLRLLEKKGIARRTNSKDFWKLSA